MTVLGTNIDQKINFTYIGQKTRLINKGHLSTLVSGVSEVGLFPQNYIVSTIVYEKEAPAEISYIRISKIEGDAPGGVVIENLIREAEGKKINWDNALKAHFYAVNQLEKGIKVRDEDLAVQLWSVGSN